MTPRNLDFSEVMHDGQVNPKSFFYSMLRIRRVEEEIAIRYPEQKMRAPVHLCIGQEATPVGVSVNLNVSDQVLSGHRSHGHYLAKGGDLSRMLAELYGKATGCCRGRGGSQHLIDTSVGFAGAAPILGSTLSIATGVAWTQKHKGDSNVVVAYLGDAATEEGVFHESLSFASLHRLPVIFVCENNLYSVHSPLRERQPERLISTLALAHSMIGQTGNGNDVREVSTIAAAAVSRARAGEGPTLLEFETYRTVGHVGPGLELDMGYRDEKEIQDWRARDPLILEEEKLRASFSNWSQVRGAMETEIEKEISTAFEFAENSEFPPVDEMLMDTYPKKAEQ